MSRILITGAAGLAGQALLDTLAGTRHEVLACDIHPPARLPDTAEYRQMDVRGDEPAQVIGDWRPDTVVHLASIVSPPSGMPRATAFAVDVTGSANVLAACLANGVRRLVVTSSGAAYGYHADNPVPLRETDALRGNPAFPYADHKRQVEELLAPARRDHPGLEQVILRIGTVLGPNLDNQITSLFRKPFMLAIRGTESPFVFIWIDDLARILLRAATDGPMGIYNVAGDGVLGVTELAQSLNKPLLRLPAGVLRAALAVMRAFRFGRYGPEQVPFLQYRPVLDNSRLKSDFGYIPRLSSAEAFATWQDSVR